VETIRLSVPELDGLDDSDWELIDTKVWHKLAQRPASYVVIRYETPVVKIRTTGKIAQGAAVTAPVLDRSIAEVSLLAGLLVDKFRFHLPLHRQHQRLQAAGITMARSTLGNLVSRAIALLEPIVDAQMESVLRSRTIAMDEVPIKVGKSKKKKGKMHQGYYWPLFGDQNEVVFTYSDSRARRVIASLQLPIRSWMLLGRCIKLRNRSVYKGWTVRPSARSESSRPSRSWIACSNMCKINCSV